MLSTLDGYAVLSIVPFMCVPVQLLFLKYGERYDLGAGMYVAAGAFVSASWSLPADRAIVLPIAGVLLLAIVAAFMIRVFALAFGRSADFTLISFGQLWATPALIDYELQRLTKGSGISLHPLGLSPVAVAFAASVFAALLGYVVQRTSLPDRLVALTEAPVQYRLLLGSPIRLALRLESLAFGVYCLAGILLGATINDLSSSTFGAESIWCVLASAPVARSSGFWIFVGPLAATCVRFLIKSIFPAQFSAMVVYATLALVLVWSISRAKEASRDATA